MPRKTFVSDLQVAQESNLPQRFFDLKAGNEDGSFLFSYQTPGFGSQTVQMQALVTDVGEYPSSHSYFVYTVSENPPDFVNSVLLDSSVFDGLRIPQLISRIAKTLDDSTRGSFHNPVCIDSGSDGDPMWIDDESDQELINESDDNDAYSDADEDYMYDDFGTSNDISASHDETGGVTSTGSHASEEAKKQHNARIRADLSKLKQAGFRVSCHTSPFDFTRNFYIIISCRIARLNISEDALAAWELQREKYVVLVLQYTNGYKTLEDVIAESKHGRYTVRYKVAVSAKRKGSRQDTIDLFSTAHDRKPAHDKPGVGKEPAAFQASAGHLERFFIDRPLDELLNGRFVDIVRLRECQNLSWDGAERYLHNHQAMGIENDAIDRTYYRQEPVKWRTRPSLRIGDHFATGGGMQSFPLITMEFMLRHLVQCTDFCLVCHTCLDSKFQAIKPYVCDKPLCLYQYMALGFGPSVEHEIVSQPLVVDLLVSLCYARASARKLRDLPVGMGLTAPDPVCMRTRGIPGDFVQPQTQIGPNGPYRMTFGETQNQLVLSEPNNATSNLKIGDWVYIKGMNNEEDLIETYRKIVSISFPVFTLATTHDNNTTDTSAPSPPAKADRANGFAVVVHPFNHKFDDIPFEDQLDVICGMLDALPKVFDMKNVLTLNKSKPLASLILNVSPSSLGILRWILASNRSCIVAIDDPLSNKLNKPERVRGMGGYLQFRFAQGAPDKEQRFMEAVHSTQVRLNNQIPTIWAWHGSHVSNWHSIIREGLHFNSVVNGRAYGNGIYNSSDARTSQGYSSADRTPAKHWSQSELKIGSILSLNEIVNAPMEFVSSNPHLVVQHLDWVQTRILFVQSTYRDELGAVDAPNPAEILAQDSRYCARGISGHPIHVPSSTISASRRKVYTCFTADRNIQPCTLSGSPPKVNEGSKDILVSEDDDDEEQLLVRELDKAAHVNTKLVRKTDFVPGTLQVSKLPRLPCPPYATPQASRALTRALKDLQKMQQSTHAVELGWHLCEEALDNIYQWIVELHTFESDLPLYKDLKAKGLTSVVLELRFGPSFPFSPPFVRVIKPRFLGFQQGGGGHVTLGGALCMELLTNDGWSAVSSIEAVLLQVKMAISSTEPRPARLPPGPVGEYGAGEAIEAYKRACAMHGWTVPPDFQQIEMSSRDTASNY